MIKINHVGYVIKSISQYEANFPLLTKLRSVFDPVQNAELALYTAGQGAMIELIQPADSSAFTWNFLEKHGGGMHHICYEGLSQWEVEDLITQKRMLKIRGPIPAVLFGQDVMFAMTRDRAIVEFLLPPA